MKYYNTEQYKDLIKKMVDNIDAWFLLDMIYRSIVSITKED